MTDVSMPHGKSMKKRVLQLVGGAIFGAVTMGLVLWLLDGARGFDLGVAELVAISAGVVFAMIGLIVMAGAAVPRAGQHILEVEDVEDLNYQRRELLLGGPVMIMTGAVPLLLGLGGPGGLLSDQLVMIAIVALVVVGAVLSLTVKFKRDELNDAIAKEAAMHTFYAIMLLFGGWAVAAHLQYTQPFPMVAFVGGAMWIWLFMIFIAAGRRGIG